jgi:hypothetical protein
MDVRVAVRGAQPHAAGAGAEPQVPRGRHVQRLALCAVADARDVLLVSEAQGELLSYASAHDPHSSARHRRQRRHQRMLLETAKSPRLVSPAEATCVPRARLLSGFEKEERCRVIVWQNGGGSQAEQGADGDMGGFTRVLHSGRPDHLMNEIPTHVVDRLSNEHGFVVLSRPNAFVQVPAAQPQRQPSFPVSFLSCGFDGFSVAGKLQWEREHRMQQSPTNPSPPPHGSNT